jgi:hypothetical protein
LTQYTLYDIKLSNLIILKQVVFVNRFNILFIRIVLGGFFAVLLTRLFYPDANIFYVFGLGAILVGLAYFAEFLRNRKNR